MKYFSFELMKKGGDWLATARRELQRTPRGEMLIWGSYDPVTIRVRDVEELASKVAASALNEYIKNQETDEIRAKNTLVKFVNKLSERFNFAQLDGNDLGAINLRVALLEELLKK